MVFISQSTFLVGLWNVLLLLHMKDDWVGGRAKVAWHDVCMPKNEGGLGLKNNIVWNSAIFMKMLWNIHINRESLWIKWVHGYYLKGRNVWE